jgi:hypothetical protein
MSESVPPAPLPTPCGKGMNNQDMFIDGARPEDKIPKFLVLVLVPADLCAEYCISPPCIYKIVARGWLNEC